MRPPPLGGTIWAAHRACEQLANPAVGSEQLGIGIRNLDGSNHGPHGSGGARLVDQLVEDFADAARSGCCDSSAKPEKVLRREGNRDRLLGHTIIIRYQAAQLQRGATRVDPIMGVATGVRASGFSSPGATAAKG